MDNIKKVIDLLNDLIKINNDRTEGYERAAEELDPARDKDPLILLDQAHKSRVLRNELRAAIARLGGSPTDDSTPAGRIYRIWMDLKTTFTAGSPASVFELCEYGEEAALQTYDKVMMEDVHWPDEIYTILKRQRDIISTSYEEIRRYKNIFKHAAELK